MKKINPYLEIAHEVQEALEATKPVVALESTILSHGLPYPENLDFAKKIEDIIREGGAVPATTAIMNGKLKVGLNATERERICNPEDVIKVSRRDVAVCIATGQTGATTVATTMIIAAAAGIRVFATGGIGGVHRGGEVTMDISADLQELAHTPVAVVCAGAKQILDIGRTLEYLETMGVPVLGYRTESFPAFYCRESGHQVDYNAKNYEEIAAIMYAKWTLGLEGAVLIGNPIPEESALDFETMERVIEEAIEKADAQGIHGKKLTPFLLKEIKEVTEGESYESNLVLAYNNAKVAAGIAKAYTALI